MANSRLARWKIEPTRDEVAHHEAGHVVVGMIAGIPIRSIDMRLEPGEHHARVNTADVTGGLILAGQLDAREGTLGGHLALGRVRCALGGYAAESIFAGKTGLPHDGPGADLDKALSYARALLPNGSESARELVAGLIIGRQWKRVRAQLRGHWQYVVAVAALLAREDEVDDQDLHNALRSLAPLAPDPVPRRLWGDDSRTAKSIS